MMGLRVLLPLLVIVLGASAQTDRIKLATLAPRGSSYHKALLEMGQKWRQSGIALTIYADGVQGGESVVVQKLRAGQLQAGMLTVTGLSDIDPSVTALQNMPMMFRSLDEVDYVRQKLTTPIEKRFQEKGFIILFWGDAGWVRFFSRRPAVRPADLKSQKMFVWQGDNPQVDLMKGYGYQPVPLETSDIYTSLQTGMIDAVPSIPYYALAGQFFAQAKHMLELNWAPLVGGAVVSKKSWDAIPEAARQSMTAAAAEAGRQIQARSRQENEEAVAAMKARGLTVHSVPPETEAEWRKLSESAYPKIRGTMVPADMFDEVVRLLKEYRGARK
jgi:TRAP-type C4-dicarboxylate transport system substrate-binding protein